MTSDDIARRLLLAENAAREAGALAQALIAGKGSLQVVEKGKQDLASRADRECEELIRARIAAAYPKDAVLGEEGGLRGLKNDTYWLLDPIDGTSNYLRGVPLWCVSIAFVLQGRCEIGVTYHVLRNEMFVATRGGGAYCNGRACRVSGTAVAARSTVGIGFSHDGQPESYARLLRNIVAAGFDYRRLGSTALSLAYVADGRFDGFFKSATKIWDALPGLLLVREAGGRAGDFEADLSLADRSFPVFAAAPGIETAFKQALVPASDAERGG